MAFSLINHTQQRQRTASPGIQFEPAIAHEIGKKKPTSKASRDIVKARINRRKAELAERKRLAQIEKERRQTELHTAKAEKAEAIARQRRAAHKAGQYHPISLILGGRALERKPSGRRHKGTWFMDR